MGLNPGPKSDRSPDMTARLPKVCSERAGAVRLRNRRLYYGSLAVDRVTLSYLAPFCSAARLQSGSLASARIPQGEAPAARARWTVE